MMNCGYEPTAALGLQNKSGDMWKTIKFNFGAKPKPKAKQIDAFNGVSCGKGHLTGADAPAPAANASCGSAAKEALAGTAAK
jgi:hypothetical protein